MEKEAIDLSSYRTRELAQRVADVTSLPGSIRQIVFTALLVFVLSPLLVSFINLLTGIESIWAWMWTILYSLLFALLLGLSIGLYRALAKLLENLESIFILSLRTTRQFVHDEARVRHGRACFPSTKECFEYGYQEIMLPVIETSLRKNFSFFSKPILWIYRSTLHQGCLRILKKTATKEQEKSLKQTNQPPQENQISASQIEANLEKAIDLVKGSSHSLRNMSLLLPRIALLLLLAFGLIPLLWHWLSS